MATVEPGVGPCPPHHTLPPLSPSTPSGCLAAVAPSTPSFHLETLQCSKEVRVRTTVEQVSNIDLVDQSFHLKLALEASWIDGKLKKRRFQDKAGNPLVNPHEGLSPACVTTNNDPLKVKEIDDEEFFSPRLNFTNMREMLVEEMWFRIFDDSPDDISVPCVVCFRWNLQAVFNAELNLVDFPLDIQRLPIHLASYWPARKRLLRIAGKVQCSEAFTPELCEEVDHQLSQAVLNTISSRCNMNDFSAKNVRVSLLPIEHSADDAFERQAFIDIVLPCEHFAKDVSDFAALKAESLFNRYLPQCGGARVTFVLGVDQSFDQPIEFPEQDDITVYIVQNLNRKYTSMINPGGFVPIEEYDLLESLSFNPRETNWKSSSSNTVYPELEIQIWCRRKYMFWFYNIILPVTLFTLVAFVACLEDGENLADRCSITLTVLLTNVAYKYMIADKLPSVNYLTLIDRYSYFSFLFMFVVVLENAVVKRWETARDAEASIVIGMLVFWGVSIVYYIVKCYWIGTRNDAAWDAAGPAADILWIGRIAPRSEKWDDRAMTAAIHEQLTEFGVKPIALRVWEGAAANEMCKKYGVQEYPGESRFAVVRFKDEDEAKEALYRLDRTSLEWADPDCQGSQNSKVREVIVEPLHNQWRVLLLGEAEFSVQRTVMTALFESSRSIHRRLTKSG